MYRRGHGGSQTKVTGPGRRRGTGIGGFRRNALRGLLVGLTISAFAAPLGAQAPPDSSDRALLDVVAAVLESSAAASRIWPGYSLASHTLLVYRPGGWAVLLNPPKPQAEGWVPYPKDWPALPVPAIIRIGGVEGLVGQLAFDYETAGGRTVAVPLYDSIPPDLGPRDRYLYAFLAHESFHQYQRQVFSDVNTPSEEVYPLLDPMNIARATLEMKVLNEAVRALGDGDTRRARRRAEEAVTIHAERWRALAGAGRVVERAKEVVEGTAKYVETRSVAEFAERCRSGHGARHRALCVEFRDLTAARWLAREFAERLKGGALSPLDMPRNRIYAVGAAVGLLLDAFDPGWKLRVQEAGTRRSLFDRLEAALEPVPGDPMARVRAARDRHGWDDIRASSQGQVQAYLDGYEEALASFRGRPGLRVTVELPDRGLDRSRASREARWVVDGGRRVLGTFVSYTLRRRAEPSFRLAVRNRPILDETLKNGRKRVTFPMARVSSLSVDGEHVAPEPLDRRGFQALELTGEGVELESRLGGTLVRDGRNIIIRHDQ